MGSSAKVVDSVYGHFVADAETYERDLLDAYDSKTETFGHLSDTEGRP